MKPHFTVIATLLTVGALLACPGTALAAETWHGDCNTAPTSWKELSNWTNADICTATVTPATDVDIFASNDGNATPECVFDADTNDYNITTLDVEADGTSEMKFTYTSAKILSTSGDATFKSHASYAAVFVYDPDQSGGAVDPFDPKKLVFKGKTSKPVNVDFDEDFTIGDTDGAVDTKVVSEVTIGAITGKTAKLGELKIGDNNDDGDLTVDDAGSVQPNRIHIQGGNVAGEISYLRVTSGELKTIS